MNFEYKMVLMGVLLFAVGVPLVLKLVLPNSVVRSAGIKFSHGRSCNRCHGARCSAIDT
jgi:hypothetical protein